MTIIEQMVAQKMNEVLAEVDVLSEKMAVDALSNAGKTPSVSALSEQKTLNDENSKEMVRLTMATMILKGLV